MTIPMKLRVLSAGVIALGLASGDWSIAQTSSAGQRLPDAPESQLLAQAVNQPPGASSSSLGQVAAGQAGSNPANGKQQLKRKQAEQMALKNNPRVTVAHLLAMAQHQVYRETRSAELPTANAAVTAVEAENASRISAGSLTASRLFEHAGAGGGFSQLITDFGKTRNLVASSALQEKAQNANALATQYDIQLAVDQAFYNVLQAQQTLKVAQQDVTTRQTLESQVNQMTANKLKSTLDLSFADVSLSQARLLALDAQNNADSTMAALDAVLGLDHQVDFELVDEGGDDQQPPSDLNQLV